ncbi:MAG: glycosyltransferase family 4 protein [Paludibacteraceae bacterium]|nr:glycosyltransferase family 4 protein [Paludibacteraceae bacterium]
MKIVEVIPKLISGGAEKFVVDLSNELYRQGHDVTLVSLYDTDQSCILESALLKNIKKVSLHKHLGLDWKCMLALLQFIRRERPDVVHVHIGAIRYVMLPLVWMRKTSFFATIHNEPAYEAFSKMDLYIKKFLFAFKRMAPVVISDSFVDTFEKIYHRTPVMIYNGAVEYDKEVSEEIKQYRENVDFLFVHVGRIQKVKNQLVLVKAFSRLIEEGCKVRLLILGRVEDNELLPPLSKYFNDNILYLGEKTDVRSYMKVSDALCMTSIVEGMPISIIEGMSVGCVPLVTPAGGCVDMIDQGVNGMFSSDFTEESYYQLLQQYMEFDRERRNNMSQSAIKKYQDCYSMKICAENYLSAFNCQKN